MRRSLLLTALLGMLLLGAQASEMARRVGTPVGGVTVSGGRCPTLLPEKCSRLQPTPALHPIHFICSDMEEAEAVAATGRKMLDGGGDSSSPYEPSHHDDSYDPCHGDDHCCSLVCKCKYWKRRCWYDKHSHKRVCKKVRR